MPSAAGFILSTFIGLSARRLQVQIVGKQLPNSWERVPGYALSVAAVTGAYLTCDYFIDVNRELLNRRLLQLREQRAEVAAFHEFDLDANHRLTADKREARFFNLFDRFGKDYK